MLFNKRLTLSAWFWQLHKRRYYVNKQESVPTELILHNYSIMKNLLFVFMLLAPLALFSAPGNPGFDAISTALSTGDANTLAQYLGDQVKITMGDQEKTYTKAQAADALRSFFAANKPQSFAAMHKGQSRENSDLYCIGKMTATSGGYRVAIYYKETASGVAIQAMRFDKN